MGFDYVAEVLHHPLRKFTIEDKRLAVHATIIYIWMNWEQNVHAWIKANDVGELYTHTLQRDRGIENLMRIDIKLFGRTS